MLHEFLFGLCIHLALGLKHGHLFFGHLSRSSHLAYVRFSMHVPSPGYHARVSDLIVIACAWSVADQSLLAQAPHSAVINKFYLCQFIQPVLRMAVNSTNNGLSHLFETSAKQGDVCVVFIGRSVLVRRSLDMLSGKAAFS
ncbi:hypothetical protein J6590_023685 [Homalodisca vitripennis]|nr:hypothetical protein J6590_023685 [Homalodisca vitripennis]